jgi:hypothetical protein
LPKFNALLDKPPNFKIIKTRTRDLLGDMIKPIAKNPGPDKYETQVNILPLHGYKIYKLNRITTFAEEAKRMEKLPSPGQYHQELKKKPPGASKLKEERLGFIDQAIADSMITPSHYNSPRLESYKPRVSQWKIIATKKHRFEKLEQDNSPSPVTYKNDEAKDKSTHKNRSFQIPKDKIVNYFDRIIKRKNFVPSVGLYEIPKADKFITKGARTSYR